MTDVKRVEDGLMQRYVDMGDKTYAKAVAVVYGGGGGGTSTSSTSTQGESVIDAASVVWWMVTDPATSAVTFYQYGTTTVGTPTLPVKPYEYTVGSVQVTSLPATAPTAALQTSGNTSLANIDSDIGATADAAWSGTGTSTVIAALKGVFGKLANTLMVAVQQLFTYSANNSTNGASTAFTVANGASWTGTVEAAINQNFATISVISTQAVTMTVNQYLDALGTIVDVAPVNFTVSANTPYTFPIAIQGNYVKLSVSNASGASAQVTVDTYYGPLPVEPASLTQAGNKRAAIMEALPAGANIIGKAGIDQTTYGSTNAVMVGGTSQVQVTPAVTAASAYVAGNVVGGLLIFANAVQGTVLSGVLESITLAIKSTQTASFKLYLFGSAPATTFTDKTAPAIQAVDAAKLLDVITLSAGDAGRGANTTLFVADNIGKSLVLAGTSLFGVLVTTGTPTFTTTSDVVVTASILKD